MDTQSMRGGDTPRINKSDAMAYLEQVRAQFADQHETYERFLDIMKEFKAHAISTEAVIERVSLLFRGYPHLIEGFNAFIPEEHRIRLQRAGGSIGQTQSFRNTQLPPKAFQRKPSMGMVQAMGYLERIQERFCGRPEIYHAFVDILRSYQSEQKTIKQVYSQVSTLFAGHPDLLSEFMQFIPDSQSLPGRNELPRRLPSSTTGPKTTTNRPKDLAFFDKVRQLLAGHDNSYSEFIKIIDFYTHRVINKSDLIRLITPFIGRDAELLAYFRKMIGETETILKIPDAFSVDLNRCKRLGSYRRLPSKYSHAVCSGRNSLCNEALNDTLVSCPSFTSEDSTFVSSKKNQYEEALFRCEDERYEFDLLVQGNASAIQALESAAVGSSQFPTSVLHVAAIKNVYGTRTSEILVAIQANSKSAVPVLLARLKQKQLEWKHAQLAWNRLWKDVHEKNYIKSLDYQSVIYKGTEKRTLSLKSLVNEIETVYLEQTKSQNRTALNLLPSSHGLGLDGIASPPCQLEYMLDMNRVSDLVSLASTYLGPDPDREALFRFLNAFVSNIFHQNSMIYVGEIIYTVFRLVQIATLRPSQMHSRAKPNAYSTLLKLLHSWLVDMSIDQSLFEDNVRILFGPIAYLVFTFDRLLSSLSKQITAALGDETCENLVALHEAFKRGGITEQSYKQAARGLVATAEQEESMLFRIETICIDEHQTRLCFFLIPGRIARPGDEAKDDWEKYVDEFVDVHYDLSVLHKRPPLLLLRNLRRAKAPNIVRYGLECLIDRNFHMSFVAGTIDFVYRHK